MLATLSNFIVTLLTQKFPVLQELFIDEWRHKRFSHVNLIILVKSHYLKNPGSRIKVPVSFLLQELSLVRQS